MSATDSRRDGVNRRNLLKGGAGAALLAGLGSATPAKAAGKKVVIGGFVDGALVPFKDKIIPLAQQQGFDIQFLQDEYGVTLEKFFNDAQSGAGQYDLYLLDWGAPGPEDRNLKFDDYVLEYLPRAIRKVKSVAGSERFCMLGWCLGALISTLYSALRPDDGLKNLVLLTAPLGLIGVSLFLLVFNQPFGFVSLLGVIALAGMIMRNSVILVDQIDQDIAAGHSKWDAVIDATVRRARPILLTAGTAIFAMIPLSRSVFWGPMAVALMGGLLVATALTLLFLPALYAAWFRVKQPATTPARVEAGHQPPPLAIAAE